MADKTQNTRVMFLSEYWFGNPYKDLLKKELSSFGIDIVEYPYKSFTLNEIIFKYRPHILHIHDLTEYIYDNTSRARSFIRFIRFLLHILIIKIIGTKIVWTVHDLYDKVDGQCILGIISGRVTTALFDIFIAHDKKTKKNIESTFRFRKKQSIFVIPHGNYIDCCQNKIGSDIAKEILRIPDTHFVFLLFGFLHRYKGAIELIDSFKKITDKDVSLVIAGMLASDQLGTEIRERIGGHKNILFIPKWFGNDEMQLYFNACDCAVFRYKYTTTSGSLIMAMSFGRTCIAPREGYFEEVLGGLGGILYDKTNDESLYEAMKTAIGRKKELPELGARNKKWVEKHSWPHVARKTKEAYDFLLEKRRGSVNEGASFKHK